MRQQAGERRYCRYRFSARRMRLILAEQSSEMRRKTHNKKKEKISQTDVSFVCTQKPVCIYYFFVVVVVVCVCMCAVRSRLCGGRLLRTLIKQVNKAGRSTSDVLTKKNKKKNTEYVSRIYFRKEKEGKKKKRWKKKKRKPIKTM